MASLQEMREESAKLVNDARKINDVAKAENRELTAEENEQFEKLLDASQDLKSQIATEERKSRNADRLAAAISDLDEPRARRTQTEQPSGNSSAKSKEYSIKLRGKDFVFPEGSASFNRHKPEMRAAFNSWLFNGTDGQGRLYADLQTDVDASGGYLTTPEEFLGGLLKTADDEVFIRRLARKMTTTAQSTGIRTRKAKLSTAAWGQELDNTYTHRDTSLQFGKRVLTPHYFTGEAIVSRDLLRASVLDVESIVGEEIVRDFSELEEQAFLTGNGSQRPLGLFTASADGISTGRDVATGNSTTALTFDGLLEAKYSLKPKYRSSCTWLFHRTAVKNIAKIKDGDGQYIWQPSRIAGEPDRILGLPYLESEWIPSTFTAGQYVGILGDFNYYMIVDALFMDMQRLVEKYAETNQVAYIYRRKVDAMPILEEAFARVTLAS